MGWDAFKVRMNVNDLSKHVRGLPALEIDVAAPEELLDTSVATIEVGGHRVYAYTLERIAGEKLRAFLSSLPAYRAKVKKPGEAVRAKDLYDVSRIRGVYGLEQVEFWRLAGEEFRLACPVRLGLLTTAAGNDPRLADQLRLLLRPAAGPPPGVVGGLVRVLDEAGVGHRLLEGLGCEGLAREGGVLNCIAWTIDVERGGRTRSAGTMGRNASSSRKRRFSRGKFRPSAPRPIRPGSSPDGPPGRPSAAGPSPPRPPRDRPGRCRR
jgi:hypothetical protein